MTVNIKGFDSGCHELFLLISKPDGAEKPGVLCRGIYAFAKHEDLIKQQGDWLQRK